MLLKEGSPGERVPGLEELTPIRVKSVSPFSLARYLMGQEPDLNLNPEEDPYGVIFQRLKELPQPDQESLLVGFFENGVKNFPHGEALGQKLAEINNIAWFEPKGEINPAVLHGHIDEHLSRLGLDPLPLRTINNWLEARVTSWGAAWDTSRYIARMTSRLAAQDASLVAAREAAWDAAWGAAWDAAWDAARSAAIVEARVSSWSTTSAEGWLIMALRAAGDIARVAALGVADDAAWVTVEEDIMPKRGHNESNPFSPLTQICKLGCYPIGVVPKEEVRQKFAVFIPQYQKPRF